MDKILFINACVRKTSRTFELAKCALDCIEGDVKDVRLEYEDIKPLNEKSLAERDSLIEKGDFSNEMFNFARDFAESDIIVIAAPYWDLSFPSLLKVYFENITVCGIAFRYSNGIPQGLCKAKRLIYITSAGGKIYINSGFDYVKALSQGLYGINDVILFKAEGLDEDFCNVNAIIDKCKREIRETLISM